ncbi:MAG: 30S ribosomal protein S6 [Bdellovibrionota bacterium]
MIHECMVLFDGGLRREQVEASRSRIEQAFAKLGGKVHLWDMWGERRLSYPIKGKALAHIAVAYLEGSNEARAELARVLKYAEDVLRSLIVRPDEEPDLAQIAAKIKARSERDAQRDNPPPPPPPPEAAPEPAPAS